VPKWAARARVGRFLVFCRGRFLATSDAGVPLVAEIFPEAAAPAADADDVIDPLDAHHIFRHLVTELPLDPEPQRGAVGNWKSLIVHLVGENGLRMVGVNEPDRFIVFVFFLAGLEQIVGTIEHDIARIRLELDAIEQRGKRYTLPFADAAPSLDAIMPRDLRVRRHGTKLGKRQFQRLLDEASDAKLP